MQGLWLTFDTAPAAVQEIDKVMTPDERLERGVIDFVGTLEDRSVVIVARKALTGEAWLWSRLEPLPLEK